MRRNICTANQWLSSMYPLLPVKEASTSIRVWPFHTLNLWAWQTCLQAVLPREERKLSRLLFSAWWWNVTWWVTQVLWTVSCIVALGPMILDYCINPSPSSLPMKQLLWPQNVFLATGSFYNYSLQFYVRFKPSHKISHSRRLAFAEDGLLQKRKLHNATVCNPYINKTMSRRTPLIWPDSSVWLNMISAGKFTNWKNACLFRHSMSVRCAVR